MKIIIKLIIAALLFGCLAKMPYGYFQFVRIAAFIGFIVLAYMEYEAKRIVLIILYGAAAILFNPLKKIYFKRDAWNDIDIAVGIALVVCILIELYLQYGKNKKGN